MYLLKVAHDLASKTATDELSEASTKYIKGCIAVDIQEKLENTQTLKDNREARREYAKKVFTFVYVYMAAVLILIAHSHLLGLSDTVLCTLLGASTLTVLGWLTAIICYLFPKK